MITSSAHGRLLGGLFVALLLAPNLAIAAGSSPVRQSTVSHTFFGAQPLLAKQQRDGIPVSNDLLYVSNAGNNSIAIYRHDASGNTPPIAVIAGSRTGLSSPGPLSEDAQGNLYVAISRSTGNPAILVFAHGTTGNVAPIRVLSGPNTNLGFGISTLVVDQVTGKLFVCAYTPSSGARPYAQVLRFPPGANGNIAPFATSVDDMFLARQFANDSTGTNIIEAHDGADFGYFEGVATFAKQFPNGTALKYGAEISGLGTSGIADDPITRTYWVSTGYGILRVAENASGNGPDGPPGTKTHITPAPIAVITSATGCNLLALGYLRNLYAVCNYNGQSAIEVFAPTANGNATPIRVLNVGASGIYEGK